MKDTVQVGSFILSERPDGTRCVSITAKARHVDVEFTAAQWAKLADDARWFSANVTPVLPPAAEDQEAVEREETE